MIEDIGFEPVHGSFDVAEIEGFLDAMPLTARDPWRQNTFLVAWDRDSLADALARPRDHAPSGVALVVVNQRRVGVAYRSVNVEPLRRFVTWLRHRSVLRVFDDDYGGEVTSDVGDRLELLFGAPPSADDFPFASYLGDRFEIRETLAGSPERGRYRGYDWRTRRAVLVTLGPPQRDDLDAVRRELSLDVPGVAALLHVGGVENGESRYDALVEEEPAGEPWTSGDPVATGLELAATIREAHARGLVLGGVRPEVVYVDGDDRLGGVAPRCEPFLARATTRCHGVAPCFEHFFVSPEQLALQPKSPADDVFALAATIAMIEAVEHPFEGSYADNAIAIATGRRRPWRGSASLGAVLDLALVPASRRIGLGELVAKLRALR